MSLFKNAASSAPPSVAPAPAAAMTPAPVSQPASPSLVPLTEDDVKRALPANLRASVTPQMVDTINSISADPIIAENIRDNIIGYTGVLRDGKFKTEDYIHAVTYVSYKLMGQSNDEAYMRTFPSRYSSLVAQGKSKKDISAYVHAYAKGKLVNLILEQSIVPSWVLNQDAFQQAINVQVKLMTDIDVSPKVRSDAANSLLTHLKKPDAVKGQINLDITESAGIKEMKNMIAQLAQQQRQAIEAGAIRTVDVAASKLIDRDGAQDV